jgi:hypothetical protein
MSTSVAEVFGDYEIPGLDSAAAIPQALFRSRNVLAELAGLYVGFRSLPAKQPAKIVHDYRGVGAWMTTGIQIQRGGPHRALAPAAPPHTPRRWRYEPSTTCRVPFAGD